MGLTPGMNEERITTAVISLPLRYYDDRVSKHAFWNSILEETKALPGIEDAAIAVGGPPLSGRGIMRTGFFPEGQDGRPTEGLTVSYQAVSEGLFRTLGVPLLEGRSFLNADTIDRRDVVILNERAAAELWPSTSAIGRRISFGQSRFTVVGIVANVRNFRPDEEVGPQMYTSAHQVEYGSTVGTLLVRTVPGTGSIATSLRRIVECQEDDASIDLATMEQVRWRLLTEERFRTGIMMTFALVATSLAVIGIWGLVSYSVVRRTREIGLRRALGATDHVVVQFVAWQALGPTLVGVSLGLMISIWFEGFIAGYLYDIGGTDPLTVLAACLLLVATSTAASLIPARRATQTDPIVTLRHN